VSEQLVAFNIWVQDFKEGDILGLVALKMETVNSSEKSITI